MVVVGVMSIPLFYFKNVYVSECNEVGPGVLYWIY